MTRKRRIAGALAAMVLLAAACGDDGGGGDASATTTSSVEGAAPDEATTTTTEAPEVCTADRAGGTLTYGEFVATRTLDPGGPFGARGVIGGTAMLAIYDALMRYDAEAGTYEPWVAESLESNADASQWTLTLRTGITFGNGDPLDAAAVKASVERLKDPAMRSSAGVFAANIATIDVVDPTTVRFGLTGPWGSFPAFLAGEGGMVVNAKVAAAAGDQFGTMPTGAGVGAYEPVRFSPNEEVVLQAKPDYWAGPVCIEELRFIYYPNANLTYEAFVNGQMDAAFLREAPLIAKARAEDRDLLVTQSGLGGVIFVNNRPNSPGADLRVRQAVAWAIDPEIIDERVYDGQGIATTALVGPDSRYAGLVGTPYQPDEAKALVAQLVADGSFDGSLRLVCPDNPVAKNLALTVEAMLGSVGITVTSEFQASIGIAMLNGDFDLACNGVNVYDAAPYVGLSQFQTRGVNRVGFSDPEFDAAVERLKGAATEDDVRAALEELQDLWNELIPSVGFAAMEEVVAISPDLAGVRLTQDANVSFSTAYFDR